MHAAIVIIPDDAVTVYDWAARYGITRRAAAEFLDDRARIGKLHKAKKLGKGQHVNYYWAVKSVQDAAPVGRGQRRRK